ncbi:MAG TPA: polysaccharide biosynthesis tyrosine autokinase [Pyrinomonadaceae bacterium]|nr:polysaccharide biosynthesis tyrosine autokinase [Chloracidobacterium sp.]HRJ88763.1 polysaccharide biosynthesis tyrosine autokinase [Pyrinomonadaceae bacterium]HRK48803.1 polysaccharide biosynthesis tyrosine autokinase [Pyrinomonadaceae bacterium]
MEQDQRLTPLPKSADLRANASEYGSSYSSFYDEEVIEGKRTVQQYFRIVYKRLPLIIAIVTIVTAAAAIYMYRQPTVYQATTDMIIEPRRPKVTSKDAININFGQDANYYQTQLMLLRNRDLVKQVVIDLGLYREPNLFGASERGILASLRSIFTGSGQNAEVPSALPVVSEPELLGEERPRTILSPDEEKRADQYAGILFSGLTVDQVERTNLVNVRVKSTNQALAPKVADKIAEVFKLRDAERETQGAKNSAADLAKSIEELQNTIAQQEIDLIAEMRSSGLPLQERGQDLSASRLSSLSETWLKAMESRRQLEGRYNAALTANSRGEGMNIPDLYENKIFQDTIRLNTERKAKLQDQIRDIEKQIQETEAEKAELLVKYTPEYPEVGKKEAKIASLKETKDKTEREVSGIIDRDQKKIEKDAVTGALVSLRAQLDSKRREEAQALDAYEKEAALANVQGQAQTKLTTLKREIETKRNLLDTYTQRLKEKELEVESGAPDNIKIAANAGGAYPVGPQRSRNILVAFLLSLAAGLGLAFLLDYLDDSVKTSEDIGRHVGLPTLALIPHYFGSEKRRLRLLAANGNGNGGAPSTGLVTLEERHSPMAEAYRHLRTSLLFSSAGKPPQTILITSSQPSEGKTTTAINTAITLAQSDVDVVIVDCDLRRPRLHSHFDLENTQGLTNYLSGERNTQNLIKTCRDLPRLKVITSGPIPPNPAELLSSNEMRNLLQFLRGKYKHIIIDSPPAISFTDAAILSTQVDGVVLVAMAGRSSIHLMRRFKQRLGNLGARIYGVVLNGIKSGSVEYEYYGAGYYDYYRKSEVDTATPLMDDARNIHNTNG